MNAAKVRALLDRADTQGRLNGIALQLGLVDCTADAETVRRRLLAWCEAQEAQWTRAEVSPQWPETWERKIGHLWYTCERAPLGDGWSIGRSNRYGDSDCLMRGTRYPSLEVAQQRCEAWARVRM